MKQPKIESLIAEARAQHKWLRSKDDPNVWLSPSQAEDVGENMWLSPTYALGFVLADPTELREAITKRIQEATEEYEELQRRIAAG